MKKSLLKLSGFISKKFKHGLDTASKSFNILWRNKKLVLYFGIPLLIFAIIETLMYNMQKGCITENLTPLMQDLPDNILIIFKKIGTCASWFTYTSVILIYLAHITSITIAKMAITYHTNNIQKHTHLTFKNALSLFIPKIKNGIFWTGFILLPILIFTLLSSAAQKDQPTFISFFYATIIFSISACWSLATAFVIQALTIENLGIRKSLKKSIATIRAIFFEFLGTIFWIALVGLISYLPFLLLETFAKASIYNYITVQIVMLIIYCIITSCYEISKTLLYNELKQKNI